MANPPENVRTGFDLIAKAIISLGTAYLMWVATTISTDLTELRTDMAVMRTRFERVPELEKQISDVRAAQKAIDERVNELRLEIRGRER